MYFTFQYGEEGCKRRDATEKDWNMVGIACQHFFWKKRICRFLEPSFMFRRPILPFRRRFRFGRQQSEIGHRRRRWLRVKRECGDGKGVPGLNEEHDVADCRYSGSVG